MTPLNRINPRLLACRVLPHADIRLAASVGAPEGTRSLAFLTCDQDDTLYAALDHATKMADVSVVFGKSFYAGSTHASGPLSGEVMGVLAARDPESLTQGVNACRLALEELFAFVSMGGGVNIFPSVIASIGSYLAALSGAPVGSALAYLIAPPLEAMIGLDAALKVAKVEALKIFTPPTETNFAGAFLGGSLDSVQAAADAFTAAIADVVAQPK